MNTMTNRLFEVINLLWAYAAFVLSMVCWFYIFHEMAARPERRWKNWTDGMRVALALSVSAFGTWSNRFLFFFFRAEHHALDWLYGSFPAVVMLIGGVCGFGGYILTVHFMSVRLFGRIFTALAIIGALVLLCLDVLIYH